MPLISEKRSPPYQQGENSLVITAVLVQHGVDGDGVRTAFSSKDKEVQSGCLVSGGRELFPRFRSRSWLARTDPPDF